jgi:hypothetical protein
VTTVVERSERLPEGRAPVRGKARSGQRVGWVLILLTLGVWLLSLPGLATARLSQYGLLATASPLFIGSILLNVVAFVVCVRARRFGQSVACVVLMVVVQRAPTTLATSVPLYSWTYKHLGVVDYIQQHGALAHGVDVYHGWPGLFVVTAWFCDITGMDPVTVAHWFTPLLHFALLGLFYAVARTWRLDPFAALVATFLFEALNWVAQDYYSPQATSLLFVSGILIAFGLSRERATATPIALMIFAALVVTHQLTPYWLIVASLALTVVKRLQPRWLVFAMIGLAAAFLAFNYDSVSHFSLLSFNPVANAQSNVPTVGVFGQRVTSALVRGLSIAMWAAALACAIIQRRRRDLALEPAILAFSSFLLLGGQGYGGEAIFRVFLYSLFGCALLVAPVLSRALAARWSMAGAVSVVLVASVAASAQGFYGGWFANRMSVAQVDEARKLLNEVPIPGYITVAAPVWPERFGSRYVDFVEATAPGGQAFDYPMVYEAKLTGTDFSTASSYDKLIRTAGTRRVPTYLIITRQMAIYDWYFGILPLDALTNLERRLRNDNRWTVYKSSNQYVIFKSTPALIGAK